MNRSEYDHSEITGNDVSIEISLKEYGLAWIESERDTLFYYGARIGENGEYNRFDFSALDNNTDVFEEYDWVEFESVFSFVGLDRAQWAALSLPQKISDLLSYYGKENVFGGSCFEGLEYAEIEEGA